MLLRHRAADLRDQAPEGFVHAPADCLRPAGDPDVRGVSADRAVGTIILIKNKKSIQLQNLNCEI